MKFAELARKKSEVERSILLFGASEEVMGLREYFHERMRDKYTPKELETPWFLETDVPQEILDAFNPLYDICNRDPETPPEDNLESLTSE